MNKMAEFEDHTILNYICYLLSILLMGYKKSRATSVAVCMNELSNVGARSFPNNEPKKLLRRVIVSNFAGGSGLALKLGLRPFELELSNAPITSPSTSSSKS